MTLALISFLIVIVIQTIIIVRQHIIINNQNIIIDSHKALQEHLSDKIVEHYEKTGQMVDISKKDDEK